MDKAGNKYEALATLLWQVEMGADEAVYEQPSAVLMPVTPVLEWSKPHAKTGGVLPVAPSPHAPQERPALREGLPLVATVEAKTLDELQAEVAAFDGCDLKNMAIHLVFGEGDPQADIMILGDMPYEDDDRQGRPFCGSHGLLLDRMLAAVGLVREHVYLSNLVYWRPPGGRSPTQEEVQACLPFVERQITLVRPKILLCLGAVVMRTLLRRSEPFSRLRGKWVDYTPVLVPDDGLVVPCMPTHPPSFLLRQAAAKRQSWQDLCVVRAKRRELSS